MKITPIVVGIVSLFALVAGANAQPAPDNRIHCVTDISHEFTFYFDGRFGQNYIGREGVEVRNWGTLHKFDLAGANLLVLQSSATPCAYLPEDLDAVQRFLSGGGCVLVLGDYAVFRGEKEYRLNALTTRFGAEFLDRPAAKPLTGLADLKDAKIELYSPKIIRLDKPADWEVLVCDSQNQPVLARRPVGKGVLIVSSRGLCGRQPDAKDPINAVWWKPLLKKSVAGKPVTANAVPKDQMPENQMQRNRLPIQCSDYLKPYADSIYELYEACFPVIEKTMGVPPAEGMLTKLILLPTDGGGFSSGSAIGLAVWWGNFPQEKYGMVELISHESVHSWVHPFVEPMWNEGLATYVGILVGRQMGLSKDADATLADWIKQARRSDPDMTKCDLANGKDIPHAVAMAKPMWIFEQLRKDRPDIIARYFQAKRKLAVPGKLDRYTADDSVAVLSSAMGKDLFPWFQSLGITVSKDKTKIPIDPLVSSRQ